MFNEMTSAVDYSPFSTTATSPRKWLVQAYGRVWGASDWPWKFGGPTTQVLIADQPGYQIAAGATHPLYVFNDVDEPLEFLDPEQFFLLHGVANTLPLGKPTCFTFAERNIYFGPVPDANYTFWYTYQRGISVFDSLDQFKQGSWDETNVNDYPVFDSGFHYLLIHGAMATGLGFIGSPDADWHRGQFLEGIESMVRYYEPMMRGGQVQFKRDMLS